MHTFNNLVSPRVVSRYLDVSDIVPLLKVGKCFDEHRPIVSDDFAKSTSSAQNVFEDPISDGLHGFCMEGMVFREMHKGAVALYEVLEAT